jgi:hypothetical protein
VGGSKEREGQSNKRTVPKEAKNMMKARVRKSVAIKTLQIKVRRREQTSSKVDVSIDLV